MIIKPVHMAEYEKEKSEILCGFSISVINLINGIILVLTSCVNCSALGWWMVNYFSITVVFSNVVGVMFFAKKIQSEGFESLDFLSKHYEHLLYFRPIELAFFVTLMVINLVLLPLMYFVQLIRAKKQQQDECIPNPHLVVTNSSHQQRQQDKVSDLYNIFYTLSWLPKFNV